MERNLPDIDAEKIATVYSQGGTSQGSLYYTDETGQYIVQENRVENRGSADESSLEGLPGAVKSGNEEGGYEYYESDTIKSHETVIYQIKVPLNYNLTEGQVQKLTNVAKVFDSQDEDGEEIRSRDITRLEKNYKELEIDKEALGEDGSTITYEIKVTNTGTEDVGEFYLQDIRNGDPKENDNLLNITGVTWKFQGGSEESSLEESDISSMRSSSSEESSGSQAGYQFTRKLTPGQSVIFTATATKNSGTLTGHTVNKAVVTYNDGGTITLRYAERVDAADTDFCQDETALNGVTGKISSTAASYATGSPSEGTGPSASEDVAPLERHAFTVGKTVQLNSDQLTYHQLDFTDEEDLRDALTYTISIEPDHTDLTDYTNAGFEITDQLPAGIEYAGNATASTVLQVISNPSTKLIITATSKSNTTPNLQTRPRPGS